MFDMVRAGIIMNCIGVVLIVICIYVLGIVVLPIDPGSFPEWAVVVTK